MSSIKTFGKEVCDILGLKNCERITITHRVGCIPRAYAVLLLKDGEKLEEIKKAIEKYDLIRSNG